MALGQIHFSSNRLIKIPSNCKWWISLFIIPNFSNEFDVDAGLQWRFLLPNHY